MILILVSVAVLALALLAVIITARVKPQWFTPLFKFLLRSRIIRSQVSEKIAKEIKDDPGQFEELVAESFGRQNSRQMAKVVNNKSPEELQELLEKAQSGQELTVNDLQGRPRVSAREVDKRRASNKRARQARKKNRR